MELITLALFLNNDKPLDATQTDLVNRAQECLEQGYITREEAVITLQETFSKDDFYF